MRDLNRRLPPDPGRPLAPVWDDRPLWEWLVVGVQLPQTLPLSLPARGQNSYHMHPDVPFITAQGLEALADALTRRLPFLESDALALLLSPFVRHDSPKELHQRIRVITSRLLQTAHLGTMPIMAPRRPLGYWPTNQIWWEGRYVTAVPWRYDSRWPTFAWFFSNPLGWLWHADPWPNRPRGLDDIWEHFLGLHPRNQHEFPYHRKRIVFATQRTPELLRQEGEGTIDPHLTVTVIPRASAH